MAKKFVLKLPLALPAEEETIVIECKQRSVNIQADKETAKKLFVFLYNKTPASFFDTFFEVIGETITSKRKAGEDIWEVLRPYILIKVSREAIEAL